jgi:hypothetical protein
MWTVLNEPVTLEPRKEKFITVNSPDIEFSEQRFLAIDSPSLK